MYNAMCVPRKQLWGDIQRHIDYMAWSGVFGAEEELREDIRTSGGWAPQQRLCAELALKAQRITERAMRAGLPSRLGRFIQEDFQRIGMVMAGMVPTSKMEFKLELMGQNVCARWHQDNYVARTIVSYNLSATDYIDDKHVNFAALNYGGKNEDIIGDASKVCSAKVGDIFFMKGTHFPSVVNGLVHKAPEKHYHRDGKVMNRLVLKVDLH
jgi:hypothetical protein